MTATHLALAAALIAAAAVPATASAQQDRPNVLVLMTDDQSVESLRVMRHTRELIGGRGVEFTRSFVNYALCCPSRATFLTGQYSHNHGVLSNVPPSGGFPRLDTSQWLPGWLQSFGYHTVHVGKFLNGYGNLSPPADVPPGWSEWYATVDPTTYRFWNYTVNENGKLVTYGADNDPGFYSTDFFSRRAADLVTKLAPSDQPFFLSVAFLAPHSGQPREPDDPGLATPAVAPRHVNAYSTEPFPFGPAFNEADVSDKPQRVSTRRSLTPARIAAIQEAYRQRLESLLSVDEGVWLVLDALFRSGEIDNTLIVFTSDNGFFHGEHRIHTGKLLPYDEALRVPLLMRGPGIPAGARLHQLVTNADLAPTILDAADATPGRVQDGRSLLELAEDPHLAWGRELLIEGGDGSGLTFAGVRNYRYSYVEYATGERELYDLRDDPAQLVSRHFDPNYSRIQAGLAQRLATLRTCTGASCHEGPELRLRARPRGCVRRIVRARVSGPDERRVDVARFFTGTRRRGVDGRSPFARRMRVRVRPGRRFLLRAVVTTDDGRAVTLDRRLRACG